MKLVILANDLSLRIDDYGGIVSAILTFYCFAEASAVDIHLMLFRLRHQDL